MFSLQAHLWRAGLSFTQTRGSVAAETGLHCGQSETYVQMSWQQNHYPTILYCFPMRRAVVPSWPQRYPWRSALFGIAGKGCAQSSNYINLTSLTDDLSCMIEEKQTVFRVPLAGRPDPVHHYWLL